MSKYHFNNFQHFLNSYKKAFKNRFNEDIHISKNLGLMLEVLYEKHEKYKKDYDLFRVMQPTSLVIKHIYNYEDVDLYYHDLEDYVDFLISEFSVYGGDFEDHLNGLSYNFCQPTPLDKTFKYGNPYVDGELTNEAIELLLNAEFQYGVYKLYDSEKEIIYIGKSKNLGNRIIVSLKEKGGEYFSLAITNNGVDATIYEAYYIGKYQPKLNVDMKEQGKSMLKLEDLKFTEPTRMYVEGVVT